MTKTRSALANLSITLTAEHDCSSGFGFHDSIWTERDRGDRSSHRKSLIELTSKSGLTADDESDELPLRWVNIIV